MADGLDAFFAVFLGLDDISVFVASVFEDDDVFGEEDLGHAVAFDGSSPPLEVVSPVEDLFVLEIMVCWHWGCLERGCPA